jgi:hypothetical protein
MRGQFLKLLFLAALLILFGFLTCHPWGVALPMAYAGVKLFGRKQQP